MMVDWMFKSRCKPSVKKSEYGNYLANYDPTTRYQFSDELSLDVEKTIIFEQDDEKNEVSGPLNNDIVYYDVRNRSYAI